MVCRLGKFELRRNVKAVTGGLSFKGKSGRNWAPASLPTALGIAAGGPGVCMPSVSYHYSTSIHSLSSDPSGYPVRLGRRLFLLLPERKEKVMADDLPGHREQSALYLSQVADLSDKEQTHHCHPGMPKLWKLFIRLSSTKFTPKDCVTEFYICKKNPIIFDVGSQFCVGLCLDILRHMQLTDKAHLEDLENTGPAVETSEGMLYQ